jgi:6-phospho-beta-glucosidase
VILTVLGGSAFSTPILARSLEPACAGDGLVLRLVGRDLERVRAVGRACRVIAGSGHVEVEEYGWSEWTRAVPGSDAVLIQVRPGGYDGRAFDETFPLQYDVPGDEGLGPGGLAAAWRCWPLLQDLIGRTREHSPRATIVLLTAPLSLLVRLAGPGVIGVCELPWTTLRTICGGFERARDASFDYHGVNHVGWIYNVKVDGRDIAESGPWPLKYLQLHYDRDGVMARQRRAPAARVRELAALATQSFEVFASGGRAEIEQALAARSAEWYPDAVVPLLRALRGDRVTVPLFLTRADDGEIQERCYRASEGRLEARTPATPPPADAAAIVHQFIRYERMAAEAVARESEELAIEALAVHPWVTSRDHAAALARCVVTQKAGESACVHSASL